MPPYLDEDIVGEIFERLPSKSLMRFRSLSKSWYSRISSPDFIRRHRLRSSQQKVLIRHLETSSPDVLNRRRVNYQGRDDVKDLYGLHSVDRFPLYHHPEPSSIKFPCNHPKFVNSCNGIFCLIDHKLGISLWNPSIRRKLTLPNQPSIGNSDDEPFIVAGIGFDQISDDYKIVRICYFDFQETVESAMVYSMKTRAWSSITPPATNCDQLYSRACFINGVLHWIAFRHLDLDLIEHRIITFNLSTHVFGKIMLPHPDWMTRKIIIIDGCLSVIAYDEEDTCCILVMKEYGNEASWDMLLRTKSRTADEEIKKVIQLNNTGHFLIISRGGRLGVYNPKTELCSGIFETNKFYKVFIETCLETLELLDSGEIVP